MPAVDVLEAERDPALLVERPEQARGVSRCRQGGQDPRFAAVDVRSVRIRRLADRLHEYAAPVVESQPGRKPG